MTGFPDVVRTVVLDRAEHRCEVCWYVTEGLQLHHRRPRGMGGSLRPDTNRASNALVACHACHAAIESHREYARRRGYLISQFGSRPPIETPVLRWGKEWVLFTDDGGVV